MAAAVMMVVVMMRTMAAVLLTDRESPHHDDLFDFFRDYENLVSEFIIPPSKRKFYSRRLGAFFDKIPFRAMTYSKKRPVENKAQKILDWLELVIP